MRLCFVLLLFVLGCTDAQWDQMATLGESAHITCYSGGKMTFRALSTGKVINETNSDGYFARWRLKDVDRWAFGQHEEDEEVSASVSGDCVIIYTR